MKIAIVIINCTGLVADIVGAIMLFYARSKQIPATNKPVGILSYAMGSEIRDLVKSIAKTNDENELVHRKSTRWLWCLVLGFGLQLIAAILEALQSLNLVE